MTAQALKHVITNGNLGASWVWLMVSTTGTVRVTKHDVEGNKLFSDSTYRLSVKWFVVTRPWDHVLSNDPDGHVLSGNRSALVQSVRAGVDVSCVVGNIIQGYAYKAKNLALSPDGNHVATQTV